MRIIIKDKEKAKEIYQKMLDDKALKLFFKKGVFSLGYMDGEINIEILKKEFQSPTGMVKVDETKLIANLHYLMVMVFKIKENDYNILV